MNLFKTKFLGIVLLITMSYSMHGQQQKESLNLNPQLQMKTFLIEREIPNAGQLTPEELKVISKASCDVLEKMDSKTIQWLHSYVTENKVYCIYKATDKELIKLHANIGGFPANVITELSATINPKTSEGSH